MDSARKVIELVPHARTNHKWTTDELKELMHLWFQGVGSEEIATKFSITVRGLNTQITRMRQNGIPIPRRKSGHKIGRANKPWTPEEVEYVIRRRNERATSETIANELSRSFYGVQGIVQALRKNGVDVTEFGRGQRKLWDPARLRDSVMLRGLSDNSEP